MDTIFNSVYSTGTSSGRDRTVSTSTDLSGSGTVTISGGTSLVVGQTYTLTYGPTTTTPLFYRGSVVSGGQTYYVFTTTNSNGSNIPYLVSDASVGGNVSVNLNTLDATTVLICFVAGTLIDTTAGPQPVETLQPGDLVITGSGERPVKFVSRNRYSLDLLDSLDSLPVRIFAGALGEGLPRRDLHVTGNHAILVDGHLVHASALINGSTIVRTTISDWPAGEPIAYYNVEMAEHSIIHAEGQPVESYVDNLPRQSWDNYAEYLELYGEDQAIQEMALPRVRYSRQLPAALKLKLFSSQEPALAVV